MSEPIDLVVFDLGGVLVQIVRAWGEAHARAGLTHHPIAEDAAFLARRAPLLNALSVGHIAPVEYYAGVAEASDGVYTPDDIQRSHLAWHWAEYPGVDAAVEAIEAAGVLTGALSNTSEPHWADLRGPDTRYPTVARLRHAVASHLAGILKPDTAIYRAFEEASGVPAARLLFFDDLPENVEAARSLGWRAERIDPAGDTAGQIWAALRQHGVLE
ncbi:MAG: HAD-IA family hydrolase [Chloroflexi bacterium]|nr:HAD-IA family hydrolase [Chloroflexota bacterium]